MAKCWSCDVEDVDEVVCVDCGKIQPIGNRTAFELLGLSRRMTQDRAEVDRAFREASKRVHPDRLGPGASAIERRLAVEYTARLNEAHRQLKDPQSRAEYLLSLEGITVGEETARTKDPEFLMDMMTHQEAVDDASDVDALEAQRSEIVRRRRTNMAAIEKYFDQGDGHQQDVARSLDELRYFRRLIDRIDAKLEEMT